VDSMAATSAHNRSACTRFRVDRMEEGRKEGRRRVLVVL
jgi:hypothetical protein